MARQTKMKIAALATAVVATLGVAAVAPATADNAGKSPVTNKHARWQHLLLTQPEVASAYCGRRTRSLAGDRSPDEAAALR